MPEQPPTPAAQHADGSPIQDPVIARDRSLLWHPYGPLTGPLPRHVTGAQGVRLQLVEPDGTEREVIDAMSSWWCQVHGYRHPHLDQAAHAQIDRFAHVMFGGLTHEGAVDLGERLVEITPPGLSHVFLVDSGSVSVEVAMKAALQYQAAQGRPGRTRLACLRGGYHGDTFATMAVGDPEGSLHATFPSLIAAQLALPKPSRGQWDAEADDLTGDPEEIEEWAAQVRQMLESARDEVAGVLCEPLLQGAGGMHPWPIRCLQILRDLCDELDLLLIADEIATGLGRLGHLTACGWAQVTPDLMCLGKALTGGYLGMAAVLASERVGAVIDTSTLRAIMHGPTFMANPLGCAVAVASLQLLTGEVPGAPAPHEAARRIGQGLSAALEPLRSLPTVADVRTLGAVGIVQLRHPVDVAAVTAAALDRGVWVRPFRDLVYTMPPLIISDDDLAALGKGLAGAVRAVEQSVDQPVEQPAAQPGKEARGA